MNRRSFFKVIGSLGASVALPTSLIDAAAEIPSGAEYLGLIREQAQYAIDCDEIICRYDILCAGINKQWLVDMRIPSEDAKSSEKMKWHREVAKDILENTMKEEGICWNDLTPLPIPAGWKSVELA